MNDKQVKLYSVDTKAFYTTGKAPDRNGEGYIESEKALADVKAFAEYKIEKTDKYIKKLKKNNEKLKDDNDKKLSKEELENRIKIAKRNYNKLKHISEVANKRFTELIVKFEGVRKLNTYYLNLKNQVTLFDSALTRCLNFEIDELTTNILIIRPYHYVILEQLMDNGFEYKGEIFCFLTASAGQMRTKKCVFLKKDSWTNTQKTLMCGLTFEDINNSMQHGFNLNKLMAYLALNNSSTDEWTTEQGFDIDKCIVIKDMETNVIGEVDYIDVDHIIEEPNDRSLSKEERKEISKKVNNYRNLFADELNKMKTDRANSLKTFKDKTKVELKYDEARDKYSLKRDEKMKEYIKSNNLDKEKDSDVIKKYKSNLNEEFDQAMQPLRDELKEAITKYRETDIKKLDKEYEDRVKEINEDVAEFKKNLEQEIRGYDEVCDLPITRQVMPVPITHSDGCGWILPSVSKKNFMARLPWIKGLLASCDFIKFCKEERIVDDESKRYKIVDIYNKEHDLLEEEISIIFSESQFKAYKYYKDWNQYKTWFKEYGCKANICKVERDTKDIKQANLNYQMFQTLTDMTDEEIEYFIKPINEHIINGYTDLKTQLDLLGVNREKRTNLQQALKIYPEMVQESFVKEELRDGLASYKKKARYAKFKMNAKYSFIIPDLYSWMQFIFNGNTDKALLEDGEVSCKLFKEENLCVNRSPQLYREIPCRKNVVNGDKKKEIKKWFTTNAIYISCKDLISKLIFCDSDGDESVVVADQVYYKIAERNMKDIRPLYFPMAKAGAELINNKNLFKALTRGYKFSNIGQYSNKITNIWNQEGEIDLDAIKILTCLNNFFIDASKTGYMPTVSTEIKEKLKQANGKSPFFFQFAKGKDPDEVKSLNNSTVNRICNKIEKRNTFVYDFSKVGKFKYETLLINNDIDIESPEAKELIKYYKELDKKKTKVFADSKLDKHELWYATFSYIKEEMNKKAEELKVKYLDMVDIIVKDTFINDVDSTKTTLWEVFGESIIETMRINIKKSVEYGEFIICEDCGKRVKAEKNKKFCPVCSKKRTGARNRNRKK